MMLLEKLNANFRFNTYTKAVQHWYKLNFNIKKFQFSFILSLNIGFFKP